MRFVARARMCARNVRFYFNEFLLNYFSHWPGLCVCVCVRASENAWKRIAHRRKLCATFGRFDTSDNGMHLCAKPHNIGLANFTIRRRRVGSETQHTHTHRTCNALIRESSVSTVRADADTINPCKLLTCRTHREPTNVKCYKQLRQSRRTPPCALTESADSDASDAGWLILRCVLIETHDDGTCAIDKCKQYKRCGCGCVFAVYAAAALLCAYKCLYYPKKLTKRS